MRTSSSLYRFRNLTHVNGLHVFQLKIWSRPYQHLTFLRAMTPRMRGTTYHNSILPNNGNFRGNIFHDPWNPISNVGVFVHGRIVSHT